MMATRGLNCKCLKWKKKKKGKKEKKLKTKQKKSSPWALPCNASGSRPHFSPHGKFWLWLYFDCHRGQFARRGTSKTFNFLIGKKKGALARKGYLAGLYKSTCFFTYGKKIKKKKRKFKKLPFHNAQLFTDCIV